MPFRPPTAKSGRGGFKGRIANLFRGIHEPSTNPPTTQTVPTVPSEHPHYSPATDNSQRVRARRSIATFFYEKHKRSDSPRPTQPSPAVPVNNAYSAEAERRPIFKRHTMRRHTSVPVLPSVRTHAQMTNLPQDPPPTYTILVEADRLVVTHPPPPYVLQPSAPRLQTSSRLQHHIQRRDSVDTTPLELHQATFRVGHGGSQYEIYMNRRVSHQLPVSYSRNGSYPPPPPQRSGLPVAGSSGWTTQVPRA
ncbi:hypothetical protein BDV95DRAFT_38561 [Massariosphaeria phaeospora]|uniref:Uncharacterized protein n=1 Tax=Massariosphaeria phaeospora TaxID=100035 RepID=A0A7C8M9G2_9PLEO|nr:hypothetical protein BDV95DRAFT_38561 [Massariosphaeria phaeospora]